VSYYCFQVVEYDTPEKLLLNEDSAFSKMVQSTGAANAQYLRSLVLGEEGGNKSNGEDNGRLDGRRKWLASSRWAAAAQFALAVSLTSSQNDLQKLEIDDENNILKKTKDAVLTLQSVLEGKHDKDIEDTLEQYQVPKDRWWSSLYKVIEGAALFLTFFTSIVNLCYISAKLEHVYLDRQVLPPLPLLKYVYYSHVMLQPFISLVKLMSNCPIHVNANCHLYCSLRLALFIAED